MSKCASEFSSEDINGFSESTESEMEETVIKKEHSAVDNIGKNRSTMLLIITCVVCLVFMIFIIFAVVVYFLIISESGPVSTEIENSVQQLQKFLLVEKTSGESKTFYSMKNINSFALYPIEHNVNVYPMLLNHDDEEEEPIIGSGKKLYECTCDLEEVKDYFEFEMSSSSYRRSETSTKSTRRTVGFLSTGVIIAGAISVLLMLYKTTSDVSLRIYADNQQEAEDLASEAMSSRIISEVLSDDNDCEENAPSNNPYWDDMKEDCEKCEKFRWRQMEEKTRKLEEKTQNLENEVEELKSKLGEYTKCKESKKRNFNGDSVELLRCSGFCKTENEGFVGTSDCFMISDDWEGNMIFFDHESEELAFEALEKNCKRNFGGGANVVTLVVTGREVCGPHEYLKGLTDFKQINVITDPEDATRDELDAFLVEFEQLDKDNCYDMFTSE